MFSISPYKLEMYLRCPQQYKFEYIDNLRKIYHKDTPPLVVGQLIHAALNHYYRRLKPEERSLDKLRDVFKSKFLDHHARKDPQYQLFNKDQKSVNDWVNKAVSQLTNFWNSELSKKEPFMAPEENPRVELENEDIMLTGRLDRVDLNNDSLEIIDYKTGKIFEEDPDPLQLDFYSLLISKIHPDKPVVRKSYYYLGDDEFKEVDCRPNEQAETLDLVKNTVEKINNDNIFEARFNDKCRFCDYKSICELYKKKSQEEDLPF